LNKLELIKILETLPDDTQILGVNSEFGTDYQVAGYRIDHDYTYWEYKNKSSYGHKTKALTLLEWEE
jgi:hypothetical protein